MRSLTSAPSLGVIRGLLRVLTSLLMRRLTKNRLLPIKLMEIILQLIIRMDSLLLVPDLLNLLPMLMVNPLSSLL